MKGKRLQLESVYGKVLEILKGLKQHLTFTNGCRTILPFHAFGIKSSTKIVVDTISHNYQDL